jgi:predicted RNase H-like HicB family nuclease
MNEVIFNITEETDGGYIAEAVGEGIVTQGDSLDELRGMVRDAVEAYYFDGTKPNTVRLRFIREELLSTA